MSNLLQNSIMLVPLVDVGMPERAIIPTFTFPGGGLEGSTVEPGESIPVNFFGGDLIRLYLLRWEQNPDIIAAVPCDPDPTEAQMESAKRLLRDIFRCKSIPWPETPVAALT